MPSTFDKPEWDNIEKILIPEKSANPVLRCTFKNPAGFRLWVKGTPGGARIAFSEKVLSRAGFDQLQTRIMTAEERSRFFLFLSPNTDPRVKGTLAEMAERVKSGQDMIVQADVAGDGNYTDYFKANVGDTHSTDQNVHIKIAETHVKIISQDTVQRDIARLIAADLILGNFDRLSVKKSGDTKFHPGNFIYHAAAGRWLPIDNDAAGISASHVWTKKHKTLADPTPSQEELYQTAILGGWVIDDAPYSATDLPAMDKMLGPGLEKVLYDMLGAWASGATAIEQKNRTVFEEPVKDVARRIAPLVREELRKLVDEAKASKTESLFKLAKTWEHVDGLNYSVFKVRCRFAEWVLKNNTDTQVAAKNAVEYGLYRDWKEVLDRNAHRPVPNYAIPTQTAMQLAATEAAKRKIGRAIDAINIFRSKAEEEKQKKIDAALDKAATVKKTARTPGQAIEVLAAAWRDIEKIDLTDNRVLKAKVLVIAALLSAELAELQEFFKGLDRWRDSPAAPFFRKALKKREAHFDALLKGYEAQVARLVPHKMRDDDKFLFGTDNLTAQVASCRASLRTALAGK